ncbi:hypothetical protein UL360_002250 [Enterococcus faecium]|nr:hypothetical protein [Enterococcus faecium]EGP5130048.1 hypothetical protein [Enterococcus faecium]EGP5496410.1 hypothetical protein [Enterococcus faecium]EME3503847.1 hypothetical protein [Enterococcus faecium]EME3544480.1 hypothetical protein [Enterococcus faecium]
MIRDKNSEKRYAYDLQILDKERKIEEMSAQQYQVENTIESFRFEMEQNFCQLQEIEDELNILSQMNSSYSEVEQKRKYVLSLLSQHQEEIKINYRKAKNILEDERGNLQKERNQLPWD